MASPSPADLAWFFGILVYAARAPVFLIVAWVSLALLLLLLFSPWFRRYRALQFLLAGAVAWALRDTGHLLADGQLWLRLATQLGWNVPVYHEPIPAKVVGVLSDLGGAFVAPEKVLAALSVACGLGTAAVLGSSIRSRSGSSGAWAAGLALIFGLPLSFVFYGHVETYPVLALFLAGGYALIGREELTHRFRPSMLLLLLLPFVHVMNLLVLVILGLNRVAVKSRRAFLVSSGVALVLGIALLVSVDSLREYTFFSGKQSASDYTSYLLSLANAWLLLLPAALVVWPFRAEILKDGFGRFLVLAFASFSLLFLVVPMDLGPFSDLDLLTPAFITGAFLVVPVYANHAARIEKRIRTRCFLALPFLAALVTLTRSPAGEAMMAGQLRTRAMRPESKVYEYEILADHQRAEGREEAALGTLQAALAANPGSQRLWGVVGHMELQRGDTAAAVEHLERAVSAPHGYRFSGLLAEIYIRRGLVRRAVDLLNQDRQSTLSDANGSASLAVGYFQLGQPDSAVAVSEERLALEPRDIVALNNLAAGLIRLGRYDEGLEALRAAARVEPGQLEPHRKVLRLLHQLGRDDAALAYLNSLPPGIARALTEP
jgi:tetratricopeptide (TPR) repeat protein